MAWQRARFGREDVEISDTTPVYRGFFHLLKVQLRHRLYNGGWSRVFERELFSKAKAAAAVIYDPVTDRVGLVEQFRVGMLQSPMGPWSLEWVAGMVEPGESPEAMVLRELQEEAGLTARQLLPITGFYPTPGSCDEYTHLYCALCDLSEAGGVFGVDGENEDILFQTLSAQEVFDAMLQNERLGNAATLIGLLWLQLHRERLRHDWPAWPKKSEVR